MKNLRETQQSRQRATNLVKLLNIRLNILGLTVNKGHQITDLSVPMKAGKSQE